MQYRCSGAQRGFTLLESLFVLAIIAWLMTTAAPHFHDQLSAARALAGARQLYSAVHLARSMAQATASKVSLCPSVHAVTTLNDCRGHFGQTISVIHASSSGDKVLRVWSPLPEVTVLNRLGTQRVTGPIQWQPDGLSNRNLTLSVCAEDHNWSVVLNRLGRPRLAKGWGRCPE